MENNQELLKAKLLQARIDLEKTTYNYVSSDLNTKINLQYSCILNHINYKGVELDSELVKEINFAINEVKKKMSEEYTAVLANMGIKF
jgi:hypothetical protein